MSVWLSVSLLPPLLCKYLSISPYGLFPARLSLSLACHSVCSMSVFVQLAAFCLSRLSFLFLCDCLSNCGLSVCRGPICVAVCFFAAPSSVWLSVCLAFLSVCCLYVSLPPVILSDACLSFSNLLHSVCLPFICLPELSWTPSYVCLQSWTLSTVHVPCHFFIFKAILKLRATLHCARYFLVEQLVYVNRELNEGIYITHQIASNIYFTLNECMANVCTFGYIDFLPSQLCTKGM
jgi:hypothetical protein